MADQFVGLSMLVTLRVPEGLQLRGTVAGIDMGKSLTLANVYNLATDSWDRTVTLDSSNILDLKEELAPPVVSQKPATPAFIDPAILSVGKGPRSSVSQPASHAPKESIQHPVQKPIQKPIIQQPVVQQHGHISTPLPAPQAPQAPVAIPKILTRPPTHESPAADSIPAPPPINGNLPIPTKPKGSPRPRKGGAHKKNGRGGGSRPPAASRAPGQQQTAGHGWRQTPILESSASFQPFDSLRKKNGKGRPTVENGWMSEDVTDVQDLGEFDFASNLAKFSKNTVFDELRRDDQVKDTDRLVSHNRLSKPGTAGGKNFHHSENVLEVPQTQILSKGLGGAANSDFWNSEAENGGILNAEEKRHSGREHGSGRSSRRGDSKASTTRRSQSRKTSSQPFGVGGHPLNRVNSGASNIITPQILRRSTKGRDTTPDQADSSRRRQTNREQHGQHGALQTEGFYLAGSEKRVETVSPLQMLNLENIAHNEVGLTEEVMAENAGRGIAEVTLLALADPALKVRGLEATPISPVTVVIMAGNNKSGIRAVAAGRHLRNKGIDILLCVVGIERERDLLEDLRQQLRVFRNFGGRVLSNADLFKHLKAPPSVSDASPLVGVTLIIDALLGLAVSFEELRTSDQSAIYELVQWANRNEAFVLAVDVPTGIDPSNGRVNNIDGHKLYVKPRYVVALAAPKRGILVAISEDGDAAADLVGGADDWKLYLVDMGLGTAVWKKAGTKMRRGIDFDGKWIQEMRLGRDVEDDDDHSRDHGRNLVSEGTQTGRSTNAAAAVDLGATFENSNVPRLWNPSDSPPLAPTCRRQHDARETRPPLQDTHRRRLVPKYAGDATPSGSSLAPVAETTRETPPSADIAPSPSPETAGGLAQPPAPGSGSLPSSTTSIRGMPSRGRRFRSRYSGKQPRYRRGH